MCYGAVPQQEDAFAREDRMAEMTAVIEGIPDFETPSVRLPELVLTISAWTYSAHRHLQVVGGPGPAVVLISTQTVMLQRKRLRIPMLIVAIKGPYTKPGGGKRSKEGLQSKKRHSQLVACAHCLSVIGQSGPVVKEPREMWRRYFWRHLRDCK